MGPANIYEVPENMTLFKGSYGIITHTNDEEADPGVRLFDKIESQQINNKQTQKPRVLLHIALFSLILGIIIISAVLFLPHSGNRESSVEEIPAPKRQIGRLSITEEPVPVYPNFANEESSTEQILETSHAPDDANKELIITSAQDFKLLEPFHNSVDILEIDERYENDFPFLLPIGENVKNIKISGPITPQWFYFLMRKFPAVLTLTIDLDKLCSTRTSFRNIADGAIAFENVEKYVIRNFKRCSNSKISKFFMSFNFPNLKDFIIPNYGLTRDIHVVKFLKNQSNHHRVHYVLGPFQGFL